MKLFFNVPVQLLPLEFHCYNEMVPGLCHLAETVVSEQKQR